MHFVSTKWYWKYHRGCKCETRRFLKKTEAKKTLRIGKEQLKCLWNLIRNKRLENLAHQGHTESKGENDNKLYNRLVETNSRREKSIEYNHTLLKATKRCYLKPFSPLSIRRIKVSLVLVFRNTKMIKWLYRNRAGTFWYFLLDILIFLLDILFSMNAIDLLFVSAERWRNKSLRY